MQQLTLEPIIGLPELYPGNDLALILINAMAAIVEENDILIIAHKVVSKVEGRIMKLSDVTPSKEAITLAKAVSKDPRKVELILQESTKVLRKRPPMKGSQGVLICEHRLGFIMANAGIDDSNVPGEDTVVLLPLDPDESARNLRQRILEHTGKNVGIIITDTFGRPWRRGLMNVAIGLAGVPALQDLRGTEDATGRELKATMPAVADELAAASGLLMLKSANTPVILVRGYDWKEADDSARDILRDKKEDLFL